VSEEPVPASAKVVPRPEPKACLLRPCRARDAKATVCVVTISHTVGVAENQRAHCAVRSNRVDGGRDTGGA